MVSTITKTDKTEIPYHTSVDHILKSSQNLFFLHIQKYKCEVKTNLEQSYFTIK